MSDATVRPAHPEDVPFELQPLSGIRKIIAKRMTQSAREAPHFQVSMSVDMSEAVSLRKKLKAQGIKSTFNDIVMKAAARVLKDDPRMNCSFATEGLRAFKEINLGFVVAVEDGLTVPVVRQADERSLLEIGAQVKAMAERARAGKLTARHTMGGTFTISNLGMLAVDAVIPIINPGQAGILGVGGILEKPVVVDGQIEARPVCEFWLACDHRAVDGVIAAEFLAAMKEQLQEPTELVQQ